VNKLNKKTILGISIESQSKKQVLEKIKKFIASPRGFYHIVSLNPENLVLAQKNKSFKQTLETAQIKIVDGAGVVVASQILGVEQGQRITGGELMEELIELANSMRLRVLLLGGRPNLANSLADCYAKRFTEAKFKGVEGVRQIQKPKKIEEDELFSIVARYKPQVVFASFGSPYQELWLDRHSNKFDGMVCMGVGGAFDYFGGVVPRAPEFLRKIGLEWLFRLMVQPWRWRRQLRLIKFCWLVLKEKWKMK